MNEFNKTILVESKRHYGNANIYVISEHKSFIQGLTGRKTITQSDIKMLENLGFTVKYLETKESSQPQQTTKKRPTYKSSNRLQEKQTIKLIRQHNCKTSRCGYICTALDY